jgi:hypothetical protein
MGEVSERIYLGDFEVFGLYDNKLIGLNPYSEAVAPSVSYQFRFDPFSSSLFLAVPGSEFTDLGMAEPLQDVSSLISGVGSNVSLVSTGSGELYASSSVLNYSGSNWVDEGYSTALVTANQKNLGALPWTSINMGNTDFVVEGYIAPVAPDWGSPPYQLHIFGEPGGDALLLQWSTGTTLRYYMNGSATTFSLTDTLDNYYHFAFVRSGTNKYIYVNGTRVATGTFSGDFGTENYCSILGYDGVNDAVGKLVQDFRVYVGTDKGYRFSTIPTPLSVVEKQATGIVSGGLQMYIDAGNAASYPGSGTTWSDLSGNGNDATLVNSPTHTSGDSGYFQLNGSNQYVRLPIGLNQSGNTFMIIAKSTAGSKAHTTMMTTLLTGTTTSSTPYRDLTWNTTACGTYSYLTSPGVADIAASYNLNQWYSFVITEADCTQNGYFDGTETITDRALDASGAGENQQITVGTGYWGYSNMQVAAVLIYDRKLSPSEIQQNLDIFTARY